MSLDGVDISGWQRGIDMAGVEADFVIIKATEGVQGTVYNPDYADWAERALSAGMLVGFYHYANGGDPVAEADCFCDAIGGYRGVCLPCLDWEGQGNPAFLRGGDVAWCRAFLDRVRERTGATPLLYTSKGVTNTFDWSDVARDYPLWGAQYASMDPVYGYQAEPWQSREPWGAWGELPTIHQYTSELVLERNGGVDRLDGNLAHLDRDGWMGLCGGGSWDGGQEADPWGGSPVLSYAEAAAEVMEHVIDHDEAHGYSQPNRAGDGTMEQVPLSDGTTATIHGGDFDCSELVRTCYAAVGVLPFDYWESYMWTGNEDEMLTAHGFERISPYEAERGDVLLREGHTELCLGGGVQGGARHGDFPGGLDGWQGDQDGTEIARGPFDPGSWEVAYRCTLARPGQGETRWMIEGQEADEMVCIFQPNGKGYLAYFDGSRVHPLGHPDEVEALDMVYQQTHGGAHIPQFSLGSEDAPWATRLADAVSREGLLD